MSVTKLRALFASIPEPAVEAFFYGLQLAGWVPDEEDETTAAATPPPTGPAREADRPPLDVGRKVSP
jgi:hypothetical protein